MHSNFNHNVAIHQDLSNSKTWADSHNRPFVSDRFKVMTENAHSPSSLSGRQRAATLHNNSNFFQNNINNLNSNGNTGVTKTNKL